MQLTVVELPMYLKKIDGLFDVQEQQEIVNYLSLQPTSGVVIPGTGGIRKLRWAHSSKGKSGGTRIIYFYYNESVPLFLMTAYMKGRKDDLAEKEKSLFINLSKHLVNVYAKKR